MIYILRFTEPPPPTHPLLKDDIFRLQSPMGDHVPECQIEHVLPIKHWKWDWTHTPAVCFGMFFFVSLCKQISSGLLKLLPTYYLFRYQRHRYTHRHTHRDTHAHTHTPTDTYTRRQIDTHTHTHTNTLTQIHINTHRDIHRHAETYTHTDTYTHAVRHMHTHTRALACARRHIHTKPHLYFNINRICH